MHNSTINELSEIGKLIMNNEQVGEWEQRQKARFDKTSAQYELHHSDGCSQRYSIEFFNEPMTENIDISQLHVLEAMCGSGQTTQYLLSKGAKVAGLDISSEMIDSFKKRWPECNTVCTSIFDNKLEDCSFDCVVVVAGLHHLHPNVEQDIDEIHRILKPGGYFCFVEPHAGSLPDSIRRLWYKVDSLFEKNEGAIDIDDLKSRNSHRFEFIKTKYGGNIAYLFVLNSLAFRIPLRLKRFYSPMLITLESIISNFQGKRLSCFVVSQWKKK